MPYVNVKVAGKLNREQKEQIVKEMSETLLRVANKPLNVTYVVIEEIEHENWGVGAKLLG